jgi:hypothetical protein
MKKQSKAKESKIKQEIGYKVSEALTELESKIQQINIPDMAMLKNLMDQVANKKAYVEESLKNIRSDFAEKGVEVKPRPKRGRPKKKR